MRLMWLASKFDPMAESKTTDKKDLALHESWCTEASDCWGALKVTDRDTERAQSAPFRRKSQIFADSTLSPGNSSIWRAQETAGNRRLGSVTLGPRTWLGACRAGSLIIVLPNSLQARARHTNRSFLVWVALGTTPVCPRDKPSVPGTKPRFSPYFTGWKPSLRFVPAAKLTRGRRAAEKVRRKKFM